MRGAPPRAGTRERPSYVLGVDGGNTKTIALLADQRGTIVGTGRGRCSDIYAAPSTAQALGEVEAAVSASLAAAEVPRAAIAAAAFSMAGADWPEDTDYLEAAFRNRLPGAAIRVVNDGFGALRAGTPGGCGVAVVCGTGAATAARGPDGRAWHSGFWQQPQGSKALASAALRAVYREALGLGERTALSEALLVHFNAPTAEALLHTLTGRRKPRPEIDSAAAVLLDTAEMGDYVAQQIVTQHGLELGRYAAVAAERVGLRNSRFALVLAGGVLSHSSHLLFNAIVSGARGCGCDVDPIKLDVEPAAGALLLACELLTASVDAQLRERVLLSARAQ